MELFGALFRKGRLQQLAAEDAEESKTDLGSLQLRNDLVIPKVFTFITAVIKASYMSQDKDKDKVERVGTVLEWKKEANTMKCKLEGVDSIPKYYFNNFIPMEHLRFHPAPPPTSYVQPPFLVKAKQYYYTYFRKEYNSFTTLTKDAIYLVYKIKLKTSTRVSIIYSNTTTTTSASKQHHITSLHSCP